MFKWFFITAVLLVSNSAIAQTSTYLGPCNGEVRDSQGTLVSCPGERPECFSDGSCTCVPDPQC